MPPVSFYIELSRLTAPLSLMVFALIADIGTRLLVPMLRGYLSPLLGVPQSTWGWLNRKLARTNRDSNDLRKRGSLALIVMVGVTVLTAVVLLRLSALHGLGIYLLWFFVWQWSPAWSVARDMLKHTDPRPKQLNDSLKRHNILLPAVLSDVADSAVVYRVTILVLAVSLVQGLIAPILYAVIAALLGYDAFYGAVTGMLGLILAPPAAQDSTQRLFHRPAAILSQVILYLPGRVAGIFVLLGTVFTPKASILRAARLMITQGHTYPDARIGWVVAVFAGALGMAFPIDGTDWLGDTNGTARINRGALQRSLWLHAVTVALVILVLCAVLLLSM